MVEYIPEGFVFEIKIMKELKEIIKFLLSNICTERASI